MSGRTVWALLILTAFVSSVVWAYLYGYALFNINPDFGGLVLLARLAACFIALIVVSAIVAICELIGEEFVCVRGRLSF